MRHIATLEIHTVFLRIPMLAPCQNLSLPVKNLFCGAPKPMLPWAGCVISTPFHLSLPKEVVYLCCTCPEVTLGGRYPLSLPCGARTFLIRGLSACVRGCPTWSRKYCTANRPECQISCKIFLLRIYYNKIKTMSYRGKRNAEPRNLRSIPVRRSFAPLRSLRMTEENEMRNAR